MMQYLQSLGTIAIATAVGVLLRPYLQVTDLAMLLLLAVVVVAYRLQRGPALVACLSSIAVFDFWFVPPYHTFSVRDPAYVLTFVVMLAVALVMTQLTMRIREQADEAREREQRTARVFALSRELDGTEELKAQVGVVERHLKQAGPWNAAVLLDNSATSTPQSGNWPENEVFESLALRVAATWAYQNGESAGWGTGHCAEAEALVTPLKGANRTLGVAVLQPDSADEPLRTPDRLTLEALAAQAAAIFERTILSEQHRRVRTEVESERLRTALLSSLSHDLRSPLASIEGAASSLAEDSGVWQGESRRDMAETILHESRRMSRLITNLLDMVRVESGALAVHREWQPLEEALGVALLRVEERLSEHQVITDLPDALPLVPIDELLIEQVFINLLENAARYTPAGTRIVVSAWTDENEVVVQVADNGLGIPPGEEETIFQKFHRGSGDNGHAPAGGSGLGLTICRGIIAAHGGEIGVVRADSPGAVFRFTLPLVGPPLPLEPASDPGVSS
jgi:two-component system sensor histidine kinase KdpD